MKTIRQLAKENNIVIKGKLERLPDEFGQKTYQFDNGMVWADSEKVTFAYTTDGWDDCEFTVFR